MAKSKTDIAIPGRLFEIGAELQAVYDQIDESGELTPEQEKAITALDLAEQSKAGNVLALIQKAEADAEAAAQWAKFLAAKSKARERLVERLKAFVKDYLTLNGRTEIATDRGVRFCLQKNGHTPLLIAGLSASTFEFLDDEQGYFGLVRRDGMEVGQIRIPAAYVETKVVHSLNYKKAVGDIKDGTAPPYFTLGEPGTHIRIR